MSTAEKTSVVPTSHADLLESTALAHVATIGPKGEPQANPVWFGWDGKHLKFSLTKTRQKSKNLKQDPRVAISIVDPENPYRYLEIRGEVSLVEAGALAHLNHLTRKYTRHPWYYGYVYPVEQAERETRIICRIKPKKITLDAIHK